MHNNTITIHAGHVGWIVGAVGLVVGMASLAMIWTTRDVSRMQSEQQEWMRDRINQLEGRVAVLEAYQFQRSQVEK